MQLLPPTPSIYSAAEWQDWGTEGPYTASVYHPNDPAFPWRPWITLVDAWNIAHLGGGTGCVALGPGVTRSTGSLFAVTGTTSATARYVYFFETLTNLFARFPVTAGQPVDVPNPSHGDRGGPIVAFGLTNTPLRAGATMVRLQFGWPDHVRVQILDAAGRRVRTLADREFEAGAIELMWNGTDDAGRALPSGLYFAQVMCHRSDISQAKKFVILR